MMKLAVFALLALAAVASAELGEETMSELGLEPSDDKEKAQLTGNMVIFGDYCVQSRDHIAHDIKHNANIFSARVFSFVFDSAELMGKETLDVAKAGTERLSAQLANPSAAIAEPTNEAEKIYAAAQEEIQTASQPRALLAAFKASVSALSQTVGSQVSQGINQLKKYANIEELVQTLQAGCEKVGQYEKELKASFEEYKAQIAEASPEIAAVTFAQVPCATSRKISQAEGLCRLVSAAKEPLKKLYNTRN